MFESTRRYLGIKRLIVATWLDLARGKRDLKAAEALFVLNRAAKHGWGSDTTYQMKNHLIKLLYRKGYCVRAVKSVQEMECWHTRAYNEGWDPFCEKCGNTYIYARNTLYSFTFVIDGKPFNWHQPERLVDWPVKISSEPVIYNQRETVEIDASEQKVEAGKMLLYVYLRLAGVKREQLPALLSLRKAWQRDREAIPGEIKDWLRCRLKNVKRKGPVLEALQNWTDDGIPF